MKYVQVILVVLMMASLVVIGFTKPEGESFGRGMNLVVYFFGSSILVWSTTLILIIHMFFEWWRNKIIRFVISKNLMETILIIVGIIFPLLTGLLIRLKNV